MSGPVPSSAAFQAAVTASTETRPAPVRHKKKPGPKPKAKRELKEVSGSEVATPVAARAFPDFGHVNWETIPIPEGNSLLADLQRLWEHATKVMQQRQIASERVFCHCGCKTQLHPAQACMSMAQRDPATLLPYNVYFATQECVRQYNKRRMNLPYEHEGLPR